MGYTHGKRWTDSAIRDGILEVIQHYELDRMPSRSEVKAYYQDERLANAVSKRAGGWYGLAEELGLSVKDSATYFGKRHERIVAEKLVAHGYEVRQMPQNFPYDLLVDDAVKVDVKVSHLHRGAHGGFYTFSLDKPYTTCDLFVLLTLGAQNEIQHAYVVPSVFVPLHTQITMGEHKSKYDRFCGAWDYVAQYAAFFNDQVKAGA